jgi:hypothetical protein
MTLGLPSSRLTKYGPCFREDGLMGGKTQNCKYKIYFGKSEVS